MPETRGVAAASPAVARPARRRGIRGAAGRLDAGLAPYLYVAPFFAIFLVFGLFPILYTGFVSLHDWNIIGTHEWIGFDNYVALMADPRFWIALRNTVSIWALSTIPQLALALFLAHLLHDRLLRAKTTYRMSMLVPNVTSVVAVAIIFESIFGLHYGIANWGAELLGFGRINWQAGTITSHVAISTMVMWRWTGYNALIYLAALQGISGELYEAAAIDGAGRWQQFRHITIPMLRPTIIFTAIVSTIAGLQIFAEPLIFSRGPGITGGSARQFSTMTLFLYEQSFRSFKFGYAAAVAWVLFLIVMVMVLLSLTAVRRIRSAED